MDETTITALAYVAAGIGAVGSIVTVFVKLVQTMMQREAARSDRQTEDLEKNTESLATLAAVVGELKAMLTMLQRDIDDMMERRRR